MENTSITFKEFTKDYIRNFPDEFRYLQTPVQIYDMNDLSVKNLVAPTPLLKADFNFIVFATHGNFEQKVGNEIKKVSAHQALLVLQGEVTSLLRQSVDVQGYYITFNHQIVQQTKAYPHCIKLFTAAPIIRLSPDDSTFIEHLGRLLVQELKTPMPDEQIITCLFQALLIKLLKSAESKKGLSRQFDVAISFRELLYKNHLEQYNISDYARMLNISPNYLNRCVQHVWNRSAKQCMQEFIITQSQKYLQDFSLSVSEIAYRLNFNDPSYYARMFKKVMGLSPQQYRSKLMHDVSG